MSHTFAILKVSTRVYDEIKQSLIKAGYDHAIMKEGKDEVIDMHGIALQVETPVCDECGQPAETVVWDIKQMYTDGPAREYQQYGPPRFGCPKHPVESRRYNVDGNPE